MKLGIDFAGFPVFAKAFQLSLPLCARTTGRWVNATMAVPFPDMLPNPFSFRQRAGGVLFNLDCAHGNDPLRLTGSENKS
jgi:hypothetical protein